MRSFVAQLLFIGFSATAGASEVSIETQELSAGRFRLNLSSDEVLEIPDAQKALFDTAVAACAGLAPLFGKYKLDGTAPVSGSADEEAVETFSFSQEIECGSVRPAASGEAIVLDDIAEEKLKKNAADLTDRYFGLLDRGDFATAYAMQSPMQQDLSSLDAWADRQTALKSAAGEKLATSFWRITVYKNPADAALPGNYVAVDYESEYKNLPVFCGYAIWHQSVIGELTLMREEYGYLDSATIMKIPENDLPAVKQQIGCAPT